MTKRVVTYIECDVCEEPGATFDEWKPYTTDLCETHMKELVEPLREHLKSVLVSSSKSTKRATTKTKLGASAREVRDWARSQGIDVPERGSLPHTVRDAFAAAH